MKKKIAFFSVRAKVTINTLSNKEIFHFHLTIFIFRVQSMLGIASPLGIPSPLLFDQISQKALKTLSNLAIIFLTNFSPFPFLISMTEITVHQI